MSAPDECVLTEAERRICTWVGRQRLAAALREDRDPGLGPSGDGDEKHHVRGAHCEYAGSLILNLYWRPSVGSIKSRDVGGMIEVRSTDRPNGRLIVKPKNVQETPRAPFVLIVCDEQLRHFRFGGWIHAEDAKASPLLTKFGDPAHFIEQPQLKSLDDLLELIRNER